MSALHRFENRLEQLVTGAFARAFRSAVQPMEIAAALQREVDNSAQILNRQRRLAPNDFVIDLSPTDFDRLSAYGETLSRELAQMLHEYADEQRYLFSGPISLRFQRSDDLTTGRFEVRSSASAGAASVAPAPAPTPAAAPVAGPRPHVAEASPAPPPTPAYAEHVPFAEPQIALEIGGTWHTLGSPGVVVGRGSQAQLRLDDPGISRRHAQFLIEHRSEGPVLSVIDLGSTNGTLVDGRRVQHAYLRDGSVVRLAGTTIRVHLTPAGDPVRGG